MDQDQRKSKRKLWVVGIAVFVVIAACTWLLFTKSRQITVEVFVIPSDTQVTMDGKAIQAGDITITKGKHTFVGQRQFFGTVTVEYDTDQPSPTGIIFLALYPNSPEGEAYLESHPEEQTRYENIAGAEFSALQEKLNAQYPLIKNLPHDAINYKISYRVTKEKTVVYTIQLYPTATTPGSDLYKQQLTQFKNAALDWLKGKGINETNSRIEVSPDPSDT